MIEYKSYDYTRTIPVDDYILRYRDERRFMAYCRECRRYGNSWSCPPFNDSEDYLSGFRNLLIVCTGCGGSGARVDAPGKEPIG